MPETEAQNPATATATAPATTPAASSLKAEKRKLKKKKQRERRAARARDEGTQDTADDSAMDTDSIPAGVEVEYVVEQPELPEGFESFASVFSKFLQPEDLKDKKAASGENAIETTQAGTATGAEGDAEDGEGKQKMSKKQRKKLTRLTVAELKQLVSRPDLVEAWDVTASDPRLLMYLKAYRNTVPVPRHWANKRKYLQGKRGIIKPPFELPEFIQNTGIGKMRDALAEREEALKRSQKQRERTRPKMGRMDIDYQVLHDAFFKYQTKPRLTIHGDLYYEGREFETQMKEKKPGHLSKELMEALGMAEGTPPPWLFNMQRYGPPPSYPNLRIPGLNAPIPAGAQFGFHPGGWGKPPVDEYGRPLYGDVFGTSEEALAMQEARMALDRTRWGELESEEEGAAEEEEEGAEEEAGEAAGEETLAEEREEALAEAVRRSGTASVATGLETPGTVEVRKRQALEEDEDRALYTVLEQQQTSVGGAIMGSTHKYVVPDKAAAAKKEAARVEIIRSQRTEGVDVALDPDALEDEMDQAALRARYEQQERAKYQHADVSDVMAEEMRKRQAKRKTGPGADPSSKKQQKEYKF